MADKETIAFSVEIEGQERAITNLKDLKKALKDAKDAAINGDGKAAKAIGELNEKMNELNESVKTVQGSGVEKVESSFGLLGQGLKTLDLGKISEGFKGLGKAMSAIPLLLIVEGISYLVENFKELSEGSGLLAKILRTVGDAIDWIGDKVTELTDFLGITNSALDKQGEAIKGYAEKTKEALSDQTAEYNRQIAVAQSAGKATIELEKQKQEAIIQTNMAILAQILAFSKAGGELTEEQMKIAKEAANAIQDARTQIMVIENKHTQDLKKEYEKRSEDSKKDWEKRQAEELARVEQANADKLALDKALHEMNLEQIKEFNQSKYDSEAETEDAITNNFLAYSDKRRAATEKEAADRKQTQQDTQQAAYTATKVSLDAAQALTDMYYARKIKQAQGDAKLQEEIRKKQFKANKAFQLVQTAIEGARAVISASSMQPYLYVGLGASIAASVATTLALAKIASTQYEGGGGGGASSVEAPQANVSTAAPPVIQQPSNTVTQINNDGTVKKELQQTPTVKAIVVETDLTDKQKGVSKIEETAKIG